MPTSKAITKARVFPPAGYNVISLFCGSKNGDKLHTIWFTGVGCWFHVGKMELGYEILLGLEMGLKGDVKGSFRSHSLKKSCFR